MKKNILLSVITFQILLTLLPRGGSSPGLCAGLKKIMNHSYTNFRKINTGVEQDWEDRVGDEYFDGMLERKTSLELPGAKLSSVFPIGFEPDNYIAYYGMYEKELKAIEKLDSIKSELEGCLPGYEMTNDPVDKNEYQYPVRWIFKEKIKEKKPPQQLELRVERKTGRINSEPIERFKVRLIIYGIGPADQD